MDIIERLENRIHDAPMPTEHLLDDAKAEIERLRAALERITRECDGLNKGPVAVAIARQALSSK